MSYFVEVEVPAIRNLQKKLQSAYDNGAAGFFEFKETGTGAKITFERMIGDDIDLIEDRVASGMLATCAAREQIAHEFEELEPDRLSAVISALRAPGCVVRGLDSEMGMH